MDYPPKRSDPIGGSGNPAEVLRTYQTWKGSNIFFLNGRFIFGPDVRSLFLTIFLIAAPVAVFCVFVAEKLRDRFSQHLGIVVMVIAISFTLYVLVLLLMTSGRDPGIIPRRAHPPDPESFDQSMEVGAGQTPQLRLPRVKEVIVNGIPVKTKYCDTCMLYRPPRCSHCSICDNCVERFDHHCPWVGQCIGRRNYRFFFMFVSSATLLCFFVFAFCWIYIVKIMHHDKTSVWRAMSKTPASIVLIVYSFIAVWFVGGLTAFHLYLISTNQSTYENFRYRYDRQANPYNVGVIGNFKEIFWTSIPPSKNKFRAVVQREPEIPPRVVGGGFASPNLEKSMSDIELGRKPVRIEAEARQQRNLNDSSGGVSGDDVSPEYQGEGAEVRANLRPRHSSWGRRSGSWEMPSEVVGDSERGIGGDSGRSSIASVTTGHNWQQ